jgi:hypothetical protein
MDTVSVINSTLTITKHFRETLDSGILQQDYRPLRIINLLDVLQVVMRVSLSRKRINKPNHVHSQQNLWHEETVA